MRFYRSLVLLFMWSCFVGLADFCYAGSAMEEKVLAVDIPAGDAAIVVRDFAEAYDLEIIYSARILSGVSTRAIRGLFTPIEVLSLLLEDHGLEVFRDPGSGALLVRKQEIQLDPEPSNPSKVEMNSSKKSPKRRMIGAFLGAIFSGFLPQISAQQNSEVGGAFLNDDIYELQAFEVYTSAQQSAIENQREANTVGSYLSSDVLGELPDDDLGEALSRLAGVNVIGGRGVGEASVTVRGAEGQYNTIRVNGALQANARLGSRNYDLNSIPSEMVSSIEVLKSITAEHPADSIGGAVNVTTATGFTAGERITRYKFEARFRDQADQWGYGSNIVHSDVFGVFGKEDNLGIFLNFNYVNEDLINWNTQNRFLDQESRLEGDDPDSLAIANAAILAVNPNASIPIWDRFDADERRVGKKDFTFSGSFDLKLNDATTLYFRPWVSIYDETDDLGAVRFDRIERSFRGNYFFLDENGNPLGDWEDSDGDGILGSADDTFVRATDSSGNMIVTPNFESGHDGRLYRQSRVLITEATTYTLDFGGETKTETGLFDYRFLYSVDDATNDNREWRFQEYFTDGNVGDHLRIRVEDGGTPLPKFTIFEVTERRGHVPSNNKTDITPEPRTPTDTAPVFSIDEIHEDVMLFEANYNHVFNQDFALKTGLRYRKANRDNKTAQLFFIPSAGQRSVFKLSEIAEFDGSYTIFDGKYEDSFGKFPAPQSIQNWWIGDVTSNPGNWLFNRSDLYDAADTAVLEESISAAYVQATWNINPEWTLIAGVRVEHTELDTTWEPSNFLVDANAVPGLNRDQVSVINQLIQDQVTSIGFNGSGGFSFGDIVENINETNDYTNFLPSAVLTYRPENTGHVFRFAWTNTLSRPDYRELVPFDLATANSELQAAGVLNLTNRFDVFDVGNPDLVEQTSMNFDLAWEYYFGNQRRNNFSIGVFQKKLKDFLQEDTFQREVEVLIDPNDPSLGTEFVTSDAKFWTNASERTIQGIEISGFFALKDLLPFSNPFIDAISIVPNYAYITGDQTDPIYDTNELARGNFVVIGTQETDSLTNQAEHIANIQLFFEMNRFSARFSYNYISELQRTPSTAALQNRTFDVAQERISLSLQYKLFVENNIRVFLEADNLTNQPQDERFIGNDAGLYTTSYEETGRRYVFGLRGSF